MWDTHDIRLLDIEAGPDISLFPRWEIFVYSAGCEWLSWQLLDIGDQNNKTENLLLRLAVPDIHPWLLVTLRTRQLDLQPTTTPLLVLPANY